MIKTDPKLYEGTYPLTPRLSDSVPMKCWFYRVPDLDENGVEKIDIMHYIRHCKRFPDDMVVRYQADRLYKNFDKWELFILGIIFPLVHERALERISKFCSNDFQAIKAELVPSEKSKESFLIKDWYALHYLVELDMLDRSRTEFTEDGLKQIKNEGIERITCASIRHAIFHDDRWDGYYLCRDYISGTALWHPRVAFEFRNSKDIRFIPSY